MASIFKNGGIIGTALNYTDEGYYTILGSVTETIQYVGGATAIPTAGTTDTGISLTSLTGGIASAPQYGDLIIVSVSIAGTVNKTYNIAGFTQIADLYQNDTEDSNFFVGYAFATPIPQTFVTVTGGSGAGTDGIAITAQVFRNVSLTNPLDVTPTTFGAINGAAANPSAITPVTTGAVIVVTAGVAHDASTGALFTAPYLTNFLSVVSTGAVNRSTVGAGG